MTLTVGSLFSGIGGIDLGLERAGLTVAWQIENDPWCQQVLEKHWPDVPRYGDITTLNPEDLEPVDVLAGGFPCQPVSLAGARKAQKDDRWLWPAYFRIVRHLRPRYVLVENVPGLASAGMGDVLGDLASIGYDAEWESIPAAAVGAPHLRYRIFIVAYPNSDSQPEHPVDALERRRVMVPNPNEQQHKGYSHEVGWPPTTQLLAYPDSIGRDGRSGIFGQERWPQPTHSSQWATEPGMDRVAPRIPHRVDRLRGLGNAVVPQVAEYVGRLIMDAA